MSIIIVFLDNVYYVSLAVFLLMGFKFIPNYLRARNYIETTLTFVFHVLSSIVGYFIVKIWKWAVFDFWVAENGWQAFGFIILSLIIIYIAFIVILLIAGIFGPKLIDISFSIKEKLKLN